MALIIIIPCKPYLSASATAPHPLGRRKVERLFSLFSYGAEQITIRHAACATHVEQQQAAAVAEMHSSVHSQ
jgi:hypothetical protein